MRLAGEFEALMQAGQWLQAVRLGWKLCPHLDGEEPKPELCELYCAMGDAYGNLGYDLLAQRVYRISLMWVKERARPSYPDPDLWACTELSLGELAFRRGAVEEALLWMELGLKTLSSDHPRRPQALQWLSLARILLAEEEIGAHHPELDFRHNPLARRVWDVCQAENRGRPAYALGRDLLDWGRADLAEPWLDFAHARGVEPARLSRYLKRARQNHPQSFHEVGMESLLKQVNDSLEQGRPDLAVPPLHEFISRDARGDLSLWSLLARCYLKVGNAREGLRILEQVLELEPTPEVEAEFAEHYQRSQSNLELLPEMNQKVRFMLESKVPDADLATLAPALERIAVYGLPQEHPDRILAEDQLARFRGEDVPIETPTPAAPGWEVGQLVADLYQVEALLGAGGMGRVYRVRHLEWDHRLAVKVARPEMPSENFVIEAQNWIGLGLHPHVNTCYYVRNLGGSTCIFSEYAAGGSLGSRLAELRDREHLLRLALDCAWGLAFAHSQGLVHQDVKPDNVLLGDDGRAQIADFGLARVGSDGQVSNSGLTPAYASPEQCSGEPLTPATDTWSFAVMLLELCLGERTWRSGLAAPHVLASADLPEPLRQLLQDCLAMDPGQRPSMSQVAERLQPLAKTSAEPPQPAALRADGLNNRALSYLDLGQPAKARDYLLQALAIEPQHGLATYNLGLLQWRAAELSDEELIGRLNGDLALVAAVQAESARESSERRLEGHHSPVIGLVLDGWRVTSADESGVVRVHDLTGGPGEEIMKSRGPIPCVKAAPEGGLAFAVAKTVAVFRKETVFFSEAAQLVRVFSWSRDNRWLATGGVDGELLIWETATQRRFRSYVGHTAAITGLEVAGGILVSSSLDGTLRLFSVESGECIRVLEQIREVECLALSPNGSQIAYGVGREVLLCDFPSGENPLRLRGLAHFPRRLAYSSDGKMLISGDSAGYVRIWDLDSGRCRRSRKGHQGEVLSLVTHGDVAVSGAADGLVCSWSLVAGTPAPFQIARGRAVAELSAWEQQFRQLLQRAAQAVPAEALGLVRQARDLPGFANHPEALHAWWNLGEKLGRGALESAFQLCQEEGGVGELFALHRQRDVVVIGGQRGLAYWQGEERFDLSIEMAITQCLVSSDCTLLVFSAAGAAIGIWDLSAQKVLPALQVGSHRTLALSRDAQWLMVDSRLWSLQTRQMIREFSGHAGEVWSVALSPDGQLAATGSMDRTARLWKLREGICQAVLSGHLERVTSLDFQADGSRLVSAAGCGMHLWDTRSGLKLLDFESIQPHLHFCARFSPDGQLVLSAGNDGLLRVFSTRDGRCLQWLSGHRGPVRGLAWLPSGRAALSAGEDGTLRRWEFIWDIDPPAGMVCHRLQAGCLLETLKNVQPARAGRVQAALPVEFLSLAEELWRPQDKVFTLTGASGSLAVALLVDRQDTWESHGVAVTKMIQLSGELADQSDPESWSELARQLFDGPFLLVVGLSEPFEEDWLSELVGAASQPLTSALYQLALSFYNNANKTLNDSEDFLLQLQSDYSEMLRIRGTGETGLAPRQQGWLDLWFDLAVIVRNESLSTRERAQAAFHFGYFLVQLLLPAEAEFSLSSSRQAAKMVIGLATLADTAAYDVVEVGPQVLRWAQDLCVGVIIACAMAGKHWKPSLNLELDHLQGKAEVIMDETMAPEERGRRCSNALVQLAKRLKTASDEELLHFSSSR